MRILAQDKHCIVNPIDSSCCYVTPYLSGYALVVMIGSDRFTIGEWLTKEEAFSKLSLIFTNLNSNDILEL